MMTKDKFAELVPSVEVYYIVEKFVLPRIRKSKSKIKVLEIGVGNGEISNFLYEKGCEVHAVDFSEKCLANLKKDIIKYKIDLDYEIDKFILKEDYFDFVIMFEVLEHLKYPEKIIQRIWQILKEDGLFIASTPNINWWPFRIYFLFGRCPEDFHTTDHVQFWNLKRFRNLFESNGFIILKQCTSLGIPNVLYPFIRKYRKNNIEISGKYIFIASGLKSSILGYNQVIVARKST